MFVFIRDFHDEVPGASAKDCGNYLDMNLPMANFMANKFASIMELVKEGKIPEAREIQHDINKVVETLFSIELMPAQKEVLNQLGFDFGNCRKPFRELTLDEKKIIEKEIMPLIR